MGQSDVAAAARLRHSHVAHRLAKRVGHAPGDSDATVTRQALEPMRWSRSNLEYRR